MSLRRALILPTLAASLAAFAAFATLGALRSARAVEDQIDDRIERVAAFFRTARLPATERTLHYVREAFGVEVAIADGPSTLPPSTTRAALALEGPGSLRARLDGRDWAVRRDGPVAVLMPADQIDLERRQALVPLLVLAAAGAAAAGLLAWFAGARVAAPIERVAADARAGQALLCAPPGSPRELRELVTAFNCLVERARQAERLGVAGRLAASLAHEIRNPLATVRLAVRLMHPADPEAAERIEREIARIEEAVAELLDLSRPAPLHRESVDVGNLLADVAALLRPRAQHRGVVLDHEGTGRVTADPVRLRRAVNNLVLNAIQFSPEGGQVRLAARTTGPWVRIEVHDEGGGVPLELRDRLFEPFVTSRPDGVGLGLAVVRRVADDHGGRAGLESSPAGSTFWIELPCGDDPGR